MEKKKTVKEMLEYILNKTCENKQTTYMEEMCIGLVNGARKGNAKNFETVLKVMGEMPTESSASDNIPVNLDIFHNFQL